MAGIMPLMSHVPDSAPIISRISNADIAELILLTIPSSISSQLYPNLNDKIPAKAAVSIKAI